MQKLGPQSRPRRGRLVVGPGRSRPRGAMPALALALVVAVGALSGCGSSGDSSSASAASPTARSTAAEVSPTSDPTPTAPSTRTDPLAASPVRPVVRDGKTPKPSISVAAAKFGAAARYEDGVVLDVSGITHAKSEGQGPGVFAGEPVTRFTLTVTNGSGSTVDLNQVVVSVRYGDPQREASPVYDQTSQDLHGTLKPGTKARATYGFSIPTSSLTDVLMTVDIDGVHRVASFTGSVK